MVDDQVHRFIGRLMQLPKALEQELWQRLKQEGGGPEMTDVSYAERVGMEAGPDKGLQQGLRQGLRLGIELTLKLKFGQGGVALAPKIRQIEDVARLQTVQASIEFAMTPDAVRSIYRDAVA